MGKSGIHERFERIAQELFKGNSVQFGRALGTSDVNIRNYRTGSNSPRIEIIIDLHEKFKISLEWLLLGQGEMYDMEEMQSVSEPMPFYGAHMVAQEDWQDLVSVVDRINAKIAPGQKRDKPTKKGKK